MFWSGRKLDDLLPTQANSFNVVRLAAALAVLVSHAFPVVYGRGVIEPLAAFTPFTLGQHAVNLFFVVSGLLLANSLDRDPDIVKYLCARALRILPGLFVYGALFALVVAPALTILPISTYFADAHTFTYPLAVLAKFERAIPPHGIFVANPYAGAANEPLWTIPYELTAYIVLAVLFGFGALRTARHAALFLTLALIGFLVVEVVIPPESPGYYIMRQLARYGVCFMIGVAAFYFRRHVRTGPLFLVLSLLALVLARGTVMTVPVYILFTAHLAIVLSAWDYGFVSKWTRRDDLSYGIYIYGWPTKQTVVAVFPGIEILSLITIAGMTSVCLGLLSWRLVERPALRLKDRLQRSARRTVNP